MSSFSGLRLAFCRTACCRMIGEGTARVGPGLALPVLESQLSVIQAVGFNVSELRCSPQQHGDDKSDLWSGRRCSPK